MKLLDLLLNFRNKFTFIIGIWLWRWMAFFILLMFDKKGELYASSLYALPNVNIPSVFWYWFFLLCLSALNNFFLSSFLSPFVLSVWQGEFIEAKFREIEKEKCDSVHSSSSFSHSLKNNTDLLACKAEYYHQCGEYQKCFELTSV